MKKIPTASYGSSYGYMSMNEPRSELGYAGIKNLGCICYMNAMIQVGRKNNYKTYT
jgi:ubiquitin C-terminal hydrolase